MDKELYKHLQVVAKSRRTVFYSQLEEMLYLYVDDDLDRVRMGDHLGQITIHEHVHGRPLLTVAVVNKEAGMPGAGFFTLARKLGRMVDRDERQFFRNELWRVYSFWSQSPYLKLDGTPEVERGSKPIRAGRVIEGSKVTLRDLVGGSERIYTIVQTGESDPGQGKISNSSPLGKALIGKVVGAEVRVQVPAGRLRLRVEKIEDRR